MRASTVHGGRSQRCQGDLREGHARLKRAGYAGRQVSRAAPTSWHLSDDLIPVSECVDSGADQYSAQGGAVRETESGNRCLSTGDRPQTHPAIAVVDVSIMLNRHQASSRISTPRRFRGDSGYT
jgi:hypothetical protein